MSMFLLCLIVFLKFYHMGSHTPPLEALFSVSGGWIWLCHAYIYNELTMAKDSPHITAQCVTTY